MPPRSSNEVILKLVHVQFSLSLCYKADDVEAAATELCDCLKRNIEDDPTEMLARLCGEIQVWGHDLAQDSREDMLRKASAYAEILLRIHEDPEKYIEKPNPEDVTEGDMRMWDIFYEHIKHFGKKFEAQSWLCDCEVLHRRNIVHTMEGASWRD